MLRFLATIAILLLPIYLHFNAMAPRDHSVATIPLQSTNNEFSPRSIESQYLPNVIGLCANIIAGGMPIGDHAFQELQLMGVKTIISVDGKKPEVEVAKKYDLQYVHLPLSYDGIPKQKVKELAAAITQLKGPIYIHCHHGKHRAPTAAAVACIASGRMTKPEAMELLTLAGTSPDYRGLFESVKQAEPLNNEVLLDPSIEFLAVANVSTMAEAMVTIERSFDHLREIETAGWLVPKNRLELDPAEEVLLLREHFVELLRSDSEWLQQPNFKKMLHESIQATTDLQNAIPKTKSNATSYQQQSTLSRLSGSIEAKCKACHQQFRDVTRKTR